MNYFYSLLDDEICFGMVIAVVPSHSPENKGVHQDSIAVNPDVPVAVMPCGLDEIYPKTNRELAVGLLEKGGCLVSEYPRRHPSEERNFCGA